MFKNETSRSFRRGKDKSWYGSHVAKKKSVAERPAINFGHCMFCGFCEDYCPTGAMTMTDFFMN